MTCQLRGGRIARPREMEGFSMQVERFRYWLTGQLGKKGWTATETARRLKVSRSTVQKWLAGNGLPDRRIVPALADILEVPPIELWQFFGTEMRQTDVSDWYALRLADYVALPRDAKPDDLE